MKAFVRIDAASQDVDLIDVPIPEIDTDEVLISVKAFGVGIHDRYFIPSNVDFPYVIGSEGAGIISETGSQVQDFKVGERVIFTTILQAKGGSWAEYAAAKSSSLIRLPGNMSFQVGAAVPIAGKTALECMQAIDLSHNDKLFIGGASGAIGTLVIQLATAKGIHVCGSASERNQSYMVSLGAEMTIDYNDPDWQSKVKEWSDGGVDAALAIQPGIAKDCIEVVKDGGKLITVSGDSDKIKPVRNIIVKQMAHHQNTQQMLTEFVNDLSRGEINMVIEKEFPFENALEALQKTETRHARGKSVVFIGETDG